MEDVFGTDPDPHEAVFEDDPGQQEDEGLVAAVEGGDIGGGELPQRQQVQVVGQGPEDGEGRRPLQEDLQGHPVLSKEPAALPAGAAARCLTIPLEMF